MAGSEMRRRVIGLIGGTGAGKSTAASILRQKGFTVIDADEVSRSLTRKGEAGYRAVVSGFGRSILDETGELNRSKLASIVFSDPEQLRRLEQFLHPLMLKEIVSEIDGAATDPVFLDCAVLLRPLFRPLADEIWYVEAPNDTRTKRIVERDGITAEQARLRLNAQEPDAVLRAESDRIISNQGSVDQLYRQLEAALKESN